MSCVVWKALLSSTIDYAGMFPPAALSFDDTLLSAARWRKGSTHPWLLNRIVFQLASLRELTDEKLLLSGADGAPWLLTILASAGEPWGVVESDLSALSSFNLAQWNAAIRKRVVGYEWKAPRDGDLITGWKRTLERIPLDALAPLVVFVEVPPEVDRLCEVEKLVALNRSGRLQFGVKVRTGGTVVPSAADLAKVLVGVRRSGLQFKATQGLHDAFSRESTFGFVNLFSALAFSFTHSLTEIELEKCLLESRVGAFHVTGELLSYSQWSLNLAQIAHARMAHGGAFGSCSLDEPSDSLKKIVAL